MSSCFGKIFHIASWGESHGGGVGVVVEGCPAKVPISTKDIQIELDRRRPGQSDIVTPRKEKDLVEILSGVYEGHTLGTPIAMLVRNKDARPGDYSEVKQKFRPSHADYTYEKKYGIRNPEGGGRASVRESIARVAAGAIAKKILKSVHGVEICAYVEQVKDIKMAPLKDFPLREAVESNPVRCPDLQTAKKMIELIQVVKEEGDSLGGIIKCQIRNVPVGLGEPVFDRLEADLAKAMLSIPATKGFEIGSGFQAAFMKGSEHNDIFEMREGKVRTVTNFSGGIQGGISNGEEVYFRVAFKPTSTLLKPQKTVDIHESETTLSVKGRHDPCVLPRAVPIVEAMAALVLVDHWLQNRIYNVYSE